MKGIRWEEGRKKWRAYYKNSTLGYFEEESQAIQARQKAEIKAASSQTVPKTHYSQSDLARVLGVSRGAIADRVRRKTLPPFDEEKMWCFETIKHLLGENESGQ